MIKSAKTGILLGAVLAFFVCSNVAVSQATDSWLTIRSKNFTITGNASEIDARAASKRLENFRWALGQLYPQIKFDNGRRTKIILFKDAASYYSFLPKRPDGSTDEGVSGYFQAGEETNYITLAAVSDQADPLSTVVHEYVHSVADANFEGLTIPPWLNEGLAEYFETTRIENDRSIILGSGQRSHVLLLRRTGLIPLADLFAIDADALRTTTPERRRQFYAESWLLVQTLIGSGKLSINDLWQTLRKISGKTSAAEVIGIEPLSLEKTLRLALLQRSLPQLSINAAEPLPPDEVPVTTAVSAAQATAILGDLLFHTGDLARAELLLRQSVASEQKQPLANASLGLLLMRQAKAAEAKPFLDNAIKAGSTNYQVYFNYAYAVNQEFITDGSISSFSDEAAQSMRMALEKAIELAPGFVDSYRLLALVDFVRDERLDQAAELVKKGLQFKKDDGNLKLLLARILLRRGDAIAAKQIAEQIAADPKFKNDAGEILESAYQFTQASQTEQSPNKLTLSVSRQQAVATLKRSWLTEAEMQRIDDERVNNNLNRLVIRPHVGEKQVVGRIERIACGDNEISYFIKTVGDRLILKSPDFGSIKMTVAQEGENSFSIDCGAKLEKSPAVINFKPSADSKMPATLVAISFVPDSFRLKSPVEMMAARMVAIDDDTLRRSGPSAEVNHDTIRRSITASLRRPRKGETRVLGKIESIDCGDGKTVFRISVSDRQFALASRPDQDPLVTWFTVASTQLLLECGSGRVDAPAIFTFVSAGDRTGTDGELRSIEFVPDGFVLPD